LRDKPPDRSWNRPTGVSDWGQRFGLDESGARPESLRENAERPEQREEVLAGVRPKSSVSERADGVEDALAALELPLLETRIHQRVAYAEATNAGLSVLDTAKGSKAAAEIEALTDEVLTRL
jgi:cellulose biosynthesis protein BcsQ